MNLKRRNVVSAALIPNVCWRRHRLGSRPLMLLYIEKRLKENTLGSFDPSGCERSEIRHSTCIGRRFYHIYSTPIALKITAINHGPKTIQTLILTEILSRFLVHKLNCRRKKSYNIGLFILPTAADIFVSCYGR